jgi:hypothetical protein
VPDEKLTTYWRVRSSSDSDGKPEWEQLDSPPATRDGLVGDVKVENDDQVMLVYFEDKQAQTLVVGKMRDAAALVREHDLPHRPARPPQP